MAQPGTFSPFASGSIISVTAIAVPMMLVARKNPLGQELVLNEILTPFAASAES